MLTRLLTAGLLAGVLAGLCVALIGLRTTVPLILEAERYEGHGTAGHVHTHAALLRALGSQIILAHGDAHEGASEALAPVESLSVQRFGLTVLAMVGGATGFALMVLGVMLASGAAITARTGVMWGAAGFVATGLAPAMGLAPELPGSAEIDLVARQIWWALTAGLTGVGLWGLWRAQSVGAVIGCLALLMVPHVVGAPVAQAYASAVPAELAAKFTAASLGVQGILWALVGALSGWFWVRLTPASERVGVPA